MSTTTAATEVDDAVWFAVAGAKVKIPSINSFVYYFPQGHFESTSGNIKSSGFAIRPSYIPCRVLSVQFLCSNEYDQVFAKIGLQPAVMVCGKNNHSSNGVENGNDDVVSFVKIVSRSDAQSSSCSMPKLCADTILPPLDLASNLPAQNLTIKDTLNKEWTFRHVFQMPRRNFLSTGWNDFVKEKGLNTGDSVVFMRKKSTNELFLGIRRVDARCGGAAGVVAAIESAQKGEVFEVDYYPKFESPDFVVEAEKVEEALRVNWSEGMMVKVAVENKDLLSVTWFKGKVVAVLWPKRLPRSPWRILEVKCEDLSGTLPKKVYRVNPWEVRLDHINNSNQNPLTVNSIRLFGTNIQISDPIQGGNSEQKDVDNNL